MIILLRNRKRETDFGALCIAVQPKSAAMRDRSRDGCGRRELWVEKQSHPIGFSRHLLSGILFSRCGSRSADSPPGHDDQNMDRQRSTP
jgi:hypothetical protein